MTSVNDYVHRLSLAAQVDEAMVGASAMGATDILVALTGIARLERLAKIPMLPPREYAQALNVYLARAEQIRNEAVVTARGNA